MAAFRICEAHSEEITALVADYCDDGGQALLIQTAALDFLVDLTTHHYYFFTCGQVSQWGVNSFGLPTSGRSKSEHPSEVFNCLRIP